MRVAVNYKSFVRTAKLLFGAVTAALDHSDNCRRQNTQAKADAGMCAPATTGWRRKLMLCAVLDAETFTSKLSLEGAAEHLGRMHNLAFSEASRNLADVRLLFCIRISQAHHRAAVTALESKDFARALGNAAEMQRPLADAPTLDHTLLGTQEDVDVAEQTHDNVGECILDKHRLSELRVLEADQRHVESCARSLQVRHKCRVCERVLNAVKGYSVCERWHPTE